ncbi:hypothetical protein R1sor_003512 [Riccia sorocarpa]|uniref:Uncharacterized protein n=1 Tax=Riccia sorocarpa TaxID=122646 RepID=A0ABD3H587_9MARC
MKMMKKNRTSRNSPTPTVSSFLLRLEVVNPKPVDRRKPKSNSELQISNFSIFAPDSRIMGYTEWPVVELTVNGEKLRIEQDNSSFEVGTSVWRGSLVLVRWLDRCVREKTGSAPELQGKRGIEVGAGCGAAGLGAALLGLNVLLTDIQAVMGALKRNVKRNVAATALANAGKGGCSAGKVKTAQLSWGNAKQTAAVKPPFEIVIAADVVYVDSIVMPLINCLSDVSDAQTSILLAYQLRDPDADALFWRLLPDFFSIQKVDRSEFDPEDQNAETDIFILKKK